MAQELSKLIRERRIANGLSQQELAEKMQVSQAYVSLWESGKAKLGQPQIDALENLLGGVTKTEEREADSPSPIATWLARGMGKKGLTAKEIATRAGVSVVTIYNLLSGRAESPQPKTIKALEAVLRETFESGGNKPLLGALGIGGLTDFDPYDKSQIPSKPGVYVFYDISQRPLYVGKAKDIASRIKDHQDKFWFKPPIVQTAAYIEIKDEELRDQIETVLIQFLKSNAVINKNKTVKD